MNMWTVYIIDLTAYSVQSYLVIQCSQKLHVSSVVRKDLGPFSKEHGSTTVIPHKAYYRASYGVSEVSDRN